MTRRVVLDEEYPPFNGFPEKGLGFLRSLRRNNNRPWFERHRGDFEEYVQLPMRSLISSLRPFFASFAPEYDLDPKRSLFRIYRDTRFSKDKTPYKTHAAAHFVLKGRPKGLEGSGYYVHIEPTECYVGAGIYLPDGDQLKAIRQRLHTHGEDFLSIVKSGSFKRTFGSIEGERLKRLPRGFDEGHPMTDWLKLKQFFVGVSLAPGRCVRPEFPKEIAGICTLATPLVRYLNEALGASPGKNRT